DLTPDPGTDWTELHGTTAQGAVLVRPDGFIAWRAEGAEREPERVLAEVLQSVLCR
ncbi:monooxygenase, partial [Streptomyces sp. MCAF7]